MAAPLQFLTACYEHPEESLRIAFGAKRTLTSAERMLGPDYMSQVASSSLQLWLLALRYSATLNRTRMAAVVTLRSVHEDEGAWRFAKDYTPSHPFSVPDSKNRFQHSTGVPFGVLCQRGPAQGECCPCENFARTASVGSRVARNSFRGDRTCRARKGSHPTI